MSDAPDPYTPGQVPRVLAGREAELGRIRDQISRVATFGEIGGPLLVFHAPRGLGKTSLLRTAQRQALEVGFVSVWVACSRDRPFLPELVHATGRALERAGVPTGAAAKRWRTRLDKISLELGVPGLKIGGDVVTRSEAEAPRSVAESAPIGALEDLLHGAATMARGQHGAGLVVFLDELHTASPDDLSILLNTVQNLDGEREDNPLAVVTAGLPVTPEAITRAATFGERSTFVPLDVLSDADARSLLTVPADSLGVTWSVGALDLVTGECRGHPYLLQLLGSATWQAARPSSGDTLATDHVRAGIPAARDQLDAMFRARWASATPAERAFIRAMAAVGTDNVTRAAIATQLGQPSRSISVPRERLIEKGVIEPVGHGLVRFTMPGFADYVRDRAPEG
ncbi:MAG: ATP-binding protein [Actinomycetota bacterium]|nr:ATP-binding protein [Actinomycetota bacterium]